MPRGTKRKIETPPAEEKAPKKIKLDIKYDLKEENQLPDEIVLQIYRQLERTDIVQCALACRQWYRVGQRDEFHWTYITDLTLSEYAAAYKYQRNTRLKDYPHMNLAEKIDEFKLWHSDPLHSGNPVRIETMKDSGVHWMYNEHDDLIAISSICSGYYFDFSKKHNDRLWKYTIALDATNPNYDEVEVEGQRSWKVKLFLNLKVLDSMVLVQNIRAIPNVQVLLYKINKEWNENSAYMRVANQGIDKYINRPLKSAVPQRQPDGFKEEISLFKYQLDAITWMKSVEDQIGQETIYTSASRWRGSAIYFDPVDTKIVHPKDLHKHIHKEKIRGGILADDVGLGKTFEVLGLVLASPPKAEIEPHPALIDSRSTLIMCPEHLSKQWHDEITRATNLSVLLISDINDLKKCTYEDFRSKYDVIVYVYELFKTLKYACLPSTRSKGSLTVQERNKNVKEALGELRTKRNFDEVKSPIIEHFYFHRVVFDEGHQARQHYYLKNESFDLSRHVWGQRKWFVSATPFNTDEKNVFYFLRLDDSKKVAWEYRSDLIFRDYLWRNSKDSVKDELVVPETVDDLHFVDFTPLERAIYFTTNNYDENHGSSHACKTHIYERGMKVAAEDRLAYLKRGLPEAIVRANNADQYLNDMRQSYNLEQNESKKKALKLDVESLAQKAARCRKLINIHRNAIEILEEELATLADKPRQAKTKEEKEFIGVQQRYGTKVAGLLFYLKKLFQEKPNSRVIIFSMSRLRYIEMLLNEHGIMATSVLGDVRDKVRAIEDFKKEMAPFKVIMMNSEENSAGTNMIEASHVVLLDPSATIDELRDFETQAIGRAYRQGQTKQITVVRIIFKDTWEHVMYLKMNNMPVEGLVQYNHETWKPHHGTEAATNTVQTRIAKLGKSGSFSGISLQDLKQSLEIQNNTNERKEDDENNANNDENENKTNGDKKKKPAAKKKKGVAKKKNSTKKNNNNVDEEEQNDVEKNGDRMEVEENY